MFFVLTDNSSCARFYTRGRTMRQPALSFRTDNASPSINTTNDCHWSAGVCDSVFSRPKFFFWGEESLGISIDNDLVFWVITYHHHHHHHHLHQKAHKAATYCFHSSLSLASALPLDSNPSILPVVYLLQLSSCSCRPFWVSLVFFFLPSGLHPKATMQKIFVRVVMNEYV